MRGILPARLFKLMAASQSNFRSLTPDSLAAIAIQLLRQPLEIVINHKEGLEMPRILNKQAGFACLALFAAVIFFCFLGSRTRAASSSGDVQMVVTTYRDGKVNETTATIERAQFSTSSEQAVPPGIQPAAAGDIVISQIYSNGGNPGSTYQNNYLELFNRTDNPIDFGGWRIYATSENGTFDQAISFVSSRGLSIGGHQYLLIRFGPESTNGAPVPYDIPGPTTAPSPPPGIPPFPLFNLSPSGKVFITPPGVNAFGNTCPPNSQIVDFVGYGANASCFEGSGPAGTNSNTTADLRKGAGCTDSDNNAADFDVSAPSPRNSTAPQNFCGTPPSPIVQFSQASLSTTESSGSIALLVTRTVNTSGVVTVDYATSDTSGANNCNVVNGNASSRCDYIAQIGTLQFAAGETFKIISIPLIDDSYAEGAENFLVTLSNPTGAVVGTPATTTVVLNDNETTNGVNPIDQTAFFVREQYVDFLDREPDNQGYNFWLAEINNCTPKPQCTEVKRINVSGAFFLSIEFQESGYLAERSYKIAYGDATGIATVQNVATQISVPIIRLNEFLYDSHAIGNGVIVGNSNWQQVLETNKVAYFNAFVTRPRFLTEYPQGMSPADFVNKLNSRAGGVLTQSEKDALINQLTLAQKTRAEVFRAIAENGTLKANETNRAFVLMQYFGYLRRNPNDPRDSDYTGYKFWLDKLNQFNGNYIQAEMVASFINSLEYRQRFGL
jgi:hypothetical protein